MAPSFVGYITTSLFESKNVVVIISVKKPNSEPSLDFGIHFVLGNICGGQNGPVFSTNASPRDK